MKINKEIASILSEISKEVELLTERARVENPINSTTIILRGLENELQKTEPGTPQYEKIKSTLESLYKNKEKTDMNAQASYTWKGHKINIKKSFINNGFPTQYDQVIEGDLKTYRDPLWFYSIDGINKIGSYLDNNGIIMPGHEDVIERVNRKYGLTLDPKQSITAKKDDENNKSHNYKQYEIWRDKYFIPWYKAYGKQGKKRNNILSGNYIEPELKQNLSQKTSINNIDKPMSIKSEIKKNDDEWDKTIINELKMKMLYGLPGVIAQLEKIVNEIESTQYSDQQIYNTIRYIKNSNQIKGLPEQYKIRIDELEDKMKQKNPNLRENVEDDDNSWLTHNGDYSIFDKLNNIFRLKKESVEKAMTDTRKMLHEDNVYNSISTNENDFDPSKITSDVFNDEENTGLSEKDLNKKNKLTKQVIEKLNKSLSINKEVQNILNEIRKINNENDYNVWVVNEEGNTASLASKNAKIFKQNVNLCLSHDNKIEIFKSVKELHNWLKEHNYPMPKDIQLHESVNLKEKEIEKFIYSSDDPRSRYNGLGKWIEILGLDLIGKNKEEADKILQDRDNQLKSKDDSELDEDFCCGNMGDTTSASLGTSLQYLYKNRNKKESFDKKSFVDKLKQLKEDDTDVTSSFDSAVQSNAGFGGSDTSNSDLDMSSMDSNMDTDMGQTDDMSTEQEGPANNSPMDFGDINIGGGYGPDTGNQEEDDDGFSPVPEDEFQIVDVLTDSEDNIRVKLKNLSSGEYEYKDLSEIDI